MLFVAKRNALGGRAMRQTTDLDFLLYPLAIDEMPRCPECGAMMAIAVLEAREDSPDFSTFRCVACQRSERFVIDGPLK
jgi:hypothetical protein